MEEDKIVIKFSKTEYIKKSIKECKKILFQQIIKYIIIISALLFMAICLTNSWLYLLEPKIVNNIFVYGLTLFFILICVTNVILRIYNMVRSKKSIKKIKQDISTITIDEVGVIGVIYENLYFDWAEIEVIGYDVVGGLMLKTIKQRSYILPICYLNEKELDKLNEILIKNDLIKCRVVKKHIS